MIRPVKRRRGSWSHFGRFVLLVLTAATFLLRAEGLAFAGEKTSAMLVNVADTRGLEPGLSLWLADIYNTGYWLYGLTVVLIMSSQGAILGFAFDKLIGLLGIKLDKLEPHE